MGTRTLPPPVRTARLDEAQRSWDREREQLLELLTHQQRVAQAGLMSAGLTHDINNHLQLISGAAYLALESEDPEQWREALERIQDQCCAVSDMTRAFLAFVRRRESTEPGTFEVSDLLSQAVRLLAPLASKRRVELTSVWSEDARVPGELRLAVQAVVNLASNAVQACREESGRVSLSSRLLGSDRVRIEVTDNGSGIPDEIRRQIFRPFATARGEGQGTGLGLFVVRQIVRKLDGSIRVRTTPEGTTMQIDLPLADACPAGPVAVHLPAP